jgi:hypothetical protein
LSYGQIGGYVVDTCVLLPQPLESSLKSCSNFLKSQSDKCFLTSSIRKEALALIEQSYNLVLEHFHSDLKPFLESHKITEISNRDGKVIADFFSDQKIQFKLKAHARSNIPNECINAIESYLADEIHSLPNGKRIPVDMFLASAGTALSIAKHNLEAPFEGLRCEDIVPYEKLKEGVSSGASIKNQYDVAHLASALQYQFLHNKWVIFVTNDQNEILSRQKDLHELFLSCASPQWAPDYCDDLTRNKAPIAWVNGLTAFSFKQKQILDAIKMESARA